MSATPEAAAQQDPSWQYQRLVRWSGLLTVLVALCIVAIKLFAAVETNAASVLASLMDATLDVAV